MLQRMTDSMNFRLTSRWKKNSTMCSSERILYTEKNIEAVKNQWSAFFILDQG